jgi:hypothetical protein
MATRHCFILRCEFADCRESCLAQRAKPNARVDRFRLPLEMCPFAPWPHERPCGAPQTPSATTLANESSPRQGYALHMAASRLGAPGPFATAAMRAPTPPADYAPAFASTLPIVFTACCNWGCKIPL